VAPPALAARRHPGVASLIVLALLVGAACGDDDGEDAGSSRSTTTARDTTEDTAAGETVPAEADAFCQAVLDAEEATLTEDPARIGPAIAVAVDAAPADQRPAVETVATEIEAGNPGSPAFTEAYLQLTEFAITDCGFVEVATTATEYSFGGLPDELDAGPTVVELDNQGSEIHQLMLLRVADEGSELGDLETMTEEELTDLGPVAGGAFAGPGETGSGMIDLQPGRYIAVCFLPTGATPENMPAIQSGELQGQAHSTQGMIQELHVT
jgi:hypothetical protein